MRLKGLAEGIILQSMEDLWDRQHKDDSIAFFKGKGFRDCARMAGMTTSDQIKLLHIVRGIVDNHREKAKARQKSSGRTLGRRELRKENLSFVM